jgi:hypothetical protein
MAPGSVTLLRQLNVRIQTSTFAIRRNTSLTITKENDAKLTYTGKHIGCKNRYGHTANVTLSVSIQDSPAAPGDPVFRLIYTGDIRMFRHI